MGSGGIPHPCQRIPGCLASGLWGKPLQIGLRVLAQDVQFESDMNQFRPARNLEFAHQPSLVRLDRFHAQEHEFCYLTVAVAKCEKPEHFALSFAEGSVPSFKRVAGSLGARFICRRRVARQRLCMVWMDEDASIIDRMNR